MTSKHICRVTCNQPQRNKRAFQGLRGAEGSRSDPPTNKSFQTQTVHRRFQTAWSTLTRPAKGLAPQPWPLIVYVMEELSHTCKPYDR